MSNQDKPKLPLAHVNPDGPRANSTALRTFGGGSPDPHNAASFFRSVPLLSLLDAAEAAEVMRLCSIETYPAGAVLFREDEAANAMFIIERGEVAVTRMANGGEDVRVAYLGDGSVVGEMALIVSSPRSASVETVAETRVYKLDGHAFDTLRRERSVAAYKILYQLLFTLGERRQRVIGRIDDIFARPKESIDHFERQLTDLIERLSQARQG